MNFKHLIISFFLFSTLTTFSQEDIITSLSIPGIQPTTGHHINQKIIEFNYDIDDYEAESFFISSRITDQSAVGFAVDGTLYKPSEKYKTWNNFLGDCSTTSYKISGTLVVNNQHNFPFESVTHASPGFNAYGQIKYNRKIKVESISFQDVRISGVIPSSVNQPAATFMRWLKSQDDEAKNNSLNSNGNDNISDNSNSSYSNTESNSNYQNRIYSQKMEEAKALQSKAENAMTTGDYQKAAAQNYQAALLANGTSMQKSAAVQSLASTGVAIVNEIFGNNEGSRSKEEMEIISNKNNAQKLLSKGKRFLRLNKFNNSLESLNKLADLEKKHSYVLDKDQKLEMNFFRVMAYIKDGAQMQDKEWSKAFRIIDDFREYKEFRVPEDLDKSWNHRFEKSKAFLLNMGEKYNSATSYFKLYKLTDDFYFYWLSGNSYFKKGNKQKAIEIFEDLLENGPEDNIRFTWFYIYDSKKDIKHRFSNREARNSWIAANKKRYVSPTQKEIVVTKEMIRESLEMSRKLNENQNSDPLNNKINNVFELMKSQ